MNSHLPPLFVQVWRIRRSLSGALLLLLASAARGDIQLWFSPGGPVGHSSPEHGFSREDPHKFEWSWVKEVAMNDRQAERTAVLNFLPGTHTDVYIGDVVDIKYVPNASFTAEPARWRFTIQGLDAAAEKTVLQFPNQFWTGADGYVSVIEFVGDAKKKIDYARIVVQNLTLDGNWDQQNWSGPDFLGTYKLQPLRIFARTARIRNVIIRNFGSHGAVPQTTNLLSGAECFPLWVSGADVGQEPEDGDPRPIVVEDCEIEGMHSVYGGYDTALAINARVTRDRTKANFVPEPFSTDPERRLALVRRNQIRGNHPIAMGGGGGRNSELRGVTFAGNALVGVGTIVNTDTGVISYIDLTNNIGLDISVALNHGWVNTDFKFGHHHYAVIGNSFRFKGPATFPLYQNYSWVDGKVVTDPRRFTLGRPEWGYVAGVVFAGASSDSEMAGNWFTTVPPKQFLRNLPPGHPGLGFRPVWKWDSTDSVGEGWPAFPRSASGNVTLRRNRLSSVGYDFIDLKSIEDEGEFANFDARTSQGHGRFRPPIDRSGDIFMPDGTVQRVALITSNRPVNYTWLASTSTPQRKQMQSMAAPRERVTQGALEVSLGVPTTTNRTVVWVPVRAAFQPTPASGLDHTVLLQARPVFLETRVNGEPGGNSQGVTRANGVAMIPVVVRPSNALVAFKAWADAGVGADGIFDANQDAWATSYWTKGAVVWVTMEPDVACLATGQRGRFVFHRTGTPEQLAAPLAVTVGFRTGLPKAANPRGGDYQMTAIALSQWAPGGAGDSGTVTFAAGRTEAAVDVAAVGAPGREQRVIYLTVATSSRGEYAVGSYTDEKYPAAANLLVLYK